MRRDASLLLFVLTAVLASGASAASLPSVTVGPLPGPPILYAPLATAPQLQNAGVWTAAPLMVSGASAYASGEYLYQDYIYDSYGANTTDFLFAQPETVPAAADTAFGAATGDVVYPTDAAVYGFNAADLLEFRTRLDVNGNAVYRITLNTMLQGNVAGIAIGIDTDGDADTGRDDWGDGIGSLGHLGLEHVIVTWGTGAKVDGTAVPTGDVSVDVTRNQIEVKTALAPADATWRHYVVVGLFDTSTGAFKPILDQPTATHPGGAQGTNPPPIFNVGFRFELDGDEPMGSSTLDGPEHGLDSGQRTVGFGHYRDHAQAKALAARDISTFAADIDFATIAAATDDDSNIPASGHIDRLYVSSLDLGEGATTERPMLLGKIQPYAVYVPTTYEAGTPAPLTLVLHSLSSSYNQYAVYMPQLLQQLGEERGAILLTTENRGPDGWYHHEAELDLFEAWADLATRYELDADRTTVSGYSMGGYGTYKMASQYPDLFALGFSIVGPADEGLTGGPTGGEIESEQNTLRIADNLYNVPLLMWNGLIDELVPVAGVLRYEQQLHELGYRHELGLFPTHDHFMFGTVDRWGPAQTFLGNDAVDRDPARVVFRAMPEMDVAALGLIHDHAYWVSDVVVAAGERSGLVDARSLATGVGLPMTQEIIGAGIDPAPHARRGVGWTETSESADNRLEVNLDGVDSVTLWIERAGIDIGQSITLSVDSSAAATIDLSGSFGTKTVSVSAGSSTTTVDIP